MKQSYEHATYIGRAGSLIEKTREEVLVPRGVGMGGTVGGPIEEIEARLINHLSIEKDLSNRYTKTRIINFNSQ